MKSLAARMTAWTAIALIALVGFTAQILPGVVAGGALPATVAAGLSGAASLCTPCPDTVAPPRRLSDAATFGVSRCGVA